MDKSWMRTSRTRKQYIDGVEAFIKYVVHKLQKMRNIDPREFVDNTDFDMDFGLEIPTDGPATVDMVNAIKESFDKDDLAKFQELLLDSEKPLYKDVLTLQSCLQRQKKAFNGQQEFQLALNLLTWEHIYNEVQYIKNKRGNGKRTNNKTSKNQEDTRGRGGKIQKQKRKTTEEEGSSNQVKEAYWKKFNIWKEISLQELDKLQLELVGTLCLLKKFFPQPEGCIAEETIAEETIEFFSEYHKTMKTISIPPDKHVTNENEDRKPLSVEKSSEVSEEVF
nr:hypothetical protein [Tanacetum cinerariifolium]